MKHTRHTRFTLLALSLGAPALLAGCLERRVSITSEPSNAVVYVNDVEVGRTPVDADFTYYGSYDVRIDKEGFEPLRTKAVARAPIYEYPPFDLLAIAAPLGIDTTVKWHFDLTPSLDATQSTQELEQGLIERAANLRRQLAPD